MTNRRHTVAIGVLTLMVLFSGCSMVSTPTSADDDSSNSHPDPETVFKGAYVHADGLEDVQGIRANNVTNGSETVVERMRIKQRPYVDERTKVLESPESGRVGNVYVSNATKNWFYYPNSNAAQYFVPEEPFDNEKIASDRADRAEEKLENYTVEYRGTEQVADRKTHVLDVEPKNETVEKGISAIVGKTEFVFALKTSNPSEKLKMVEQKLWIDTEHNYPLKEKIVVEEPDGERIVMTERFESVRFNTGLNDGTFTFEPPENTTVTNIS